MLFYKPMRELRNVTLVSIAGMAAACILIVIYEQAMRATADAPMSYTVYVWKSVYHSVGRDIFVMLSIILGAGGLLQERAAGTSGFTLALPVSRQRIVTTRALVGYVSVLLVAATPVIVIPLASRYMGEVYPVGQCFRFFLLWAGCGAIFYGITFWLSHRIEGDYLSVLVAIPSLMLYGALMQLRWLSHLHALNLFNILNAEDVPFFNPTSHLLVDPLPWLALVVMLLVSVSLVFAAARQMEPLDF